MNRIHGVDDMDDTDDTTGHAPDNPVTRRGFAVIIMVIGSIAISFGGLVVRSIEAADNWQVNFYRALFLFLTVVCILGYQHRGDTLARIRGIGQPGFWGGVLLAVAGIAFLQALTTTTIANALFLLASIPFLTALFAWGLLKERPRRETLVTMVVAFGGVILMVSEGLGAGSVVGNVMGLITAVCFSGYAVIVRQYRETDMFPTLIVSTAIIIVVSLLAKGGDMDIPLYDIVLCFVWGAVLSGIVNSAFIVASRHLIAAEVTLFMLLEFALGPVWVWVFVHEVPSRMTVIGGLLVIGAVAARSIVQLIKARRSRDVPRAVSPQT